MLYLFTTVIIVDSLYMVGKIFLRYNLYCTILESECIANHNIAKWAIYVIFAEFDATHCLHVLKSLQDSQVGLLMLGN